MRKLLVFFFLFACCGFAQDSLYFLIRVDDILSRNVTMLPRSITHFQNAVNSRGGKVTWMVIPHRLIEDQNLDGILSKELKASALKGNELAMHGYNHICPVCSSTGHEMFCASNNAHISYQNQKSLLEQGLKILNDTLGIAPLLFVPPGHACDTATYRAMLDKNIPFLSSTGVTRSYIYGNLFNVMQNTEFTWQLTSASYASALHSALLDIRTAGRANGYYCLLLHDPFIRQGYENGLVVNWIGELLDSLNREYAGRIKYKTISEAAAIFRAGVTAQNDNNVLNVNTFCLQQNYPNPFNPATSITFSLKESGHVSLKIYDILGRETAVLVNSYLSKGAHSIIWNAGAGNNLNSGVYFARLECGTGSKTIKMVFLK
jgi:predicted deacetylase